MVSSFQGVLFRVVLTHLPSMKTVLSSSYLGLVRKALCLMWGGGRRSPSQRLDETGFSC